MPSAKCKKQKCNDDPNLFLWYKMAQVKLKTKIADNLRTRAVIATQSVNEAIQNIYDEDPSVILLAPEYGNELPPFVTPVTLIQGALNKLNAKVDAWQGVNVQVMNEPPKLFKKYWTTADNWWNRYKSIWIGDYFFYPLLHDALYQYITQLTKTTDNVLNDLLYFQALRKILHTKVTFNRARAQPLILDQAFQKAEYLHQFFKQLGDEHSVDWSIPPNEENRKSRLHVRHYAQQWVHNILKQKQKVYDDQLIHMRKQKALASNNNNHNYVVPNAVNIPDIYINHNTSHQSTCAVVSNTKNFNDVKILSCMQPENQYNEYNSSTTSHASYTPKPYRPFRKRNQTSNQFALRSHPYHIGYNSHYRNAPARAYTPRNYNSMTSHHNQAPFIPDMYPQAAPPITAPPPAYNDYNTHAVCSPTMCNECSNQNEPRVSPDINASVASMPSLQQQLPNDSSMDSIESRDLLHSSVSIVDQEPIFGAHEMSMEFDELSFDGNYNDIFFNEDLSNLDYQYL